MLLLCAGKNHLGTFALQVAKDTLDLYDDFFQVPYPLPKLDMVAIPAFAMGAMEVCSEKHYFDAISVFFTHFHAISAEFQCF
jgi:hypothetical protein